MSFTERLAILIEAKNAAIAEFRKTADASEDLGKATTRSGRLVERLGISSAAAGAALKAGVAAGATAAGVALVRFGTAAAQATSALNEQVSATKTVFGQASDSVVRWSESTSTSIGLSQRAALSAANVFGGFFKQIGLGEENVAAFSQQMVRLSADIASFKDVAGGPEEVAQALRSGLSGEAEPLRRFGIFLDEAKVKNEALKLGLTGTNGELDDGAKIMARYVLIMRQSADAHGDVTKTAESLANQQRQLKAQNEDLAASFGRLSAPTVTGATSALNDFAETALGVADKIAGPDGTNQALQGTGKALVSLIPVVGPAISGIGAVGRAMGLVKDEAEPAKTKAQELAEAYHSYALVSGDASTSSTTLASAITQVQAKTKEAAEEQRRLQAAMEAATSTIINQQFAAENELKQTKSIAEATKDLGENAKRATDASLSLRQAQAGLADAQERLAKLRRADNTEAIRDAELDLESALLAQESAAARLSDAQERLNELRKPADVLRLRDAELALRDARLAAEKAPLDLAEAQDKLRRVREAGRSPKAIRDAELAVEEAALRVEQATQDEAEAAEHLTEVRGEGERRARQVADAERAVREANLASRQATEGVRDAQRALTDARSQSNAKAIRDAELEVEAALLRVKSAQEEVARLAKERHELQLFTDSAEAALDRVLLKVGLTRDALAALRSDTANVLGSLPAPTSVADRFRGDTGNVLARTGGTTIHIAQQTVVSNDPDEFAREMERRQRRDRLTGG